jgi:hypothetical protein
VCLFVCMYSHDSFMHTHLFTNPTLLLLQFPSRSAAHERRMHKPDQRLLGHHGGQGQVVGKRAVLLHRVGVRCCE